MGNCPHPSHSENWTQSKWDSILNHTKTDTLKIFKIKKKKFFEIKQILDGYVFYKEENNDFIVRQAVPGEIITNMLKDYSHE